MDFPEHLKLLQQLESLWGDGSEQEEGKSERSGRREQGTTAIRAFRDWQAGNKHNLLYSGWWTCSHQSVHVWVLGWRRWEAAEGGGGGWDRRGRGRAGTALQRVAEHWVSVQLARASTSAPADCARTPLCPRAHASPFRSKNINVCVLAVY